MLSLARLGLLWSALRQVVEKAEDRFKRWTKPATYSQLEGISAYLVRTKPELIIEMRSYANNSSSWKGR